jgi:hypothetical protein
MAWVKRWVQNSKEQGFEANIDPASAERLSLFGAYSI